jgi:hypothetical protein
MIFPIIVRLEAEEDIKDAFLWYESQSSALGTEFIRCIEVSFSSISKSPELYAPIYQSTRRVLVSKFP